MSPARWLPLSRRQIAFSPLSSPPAPPHLPYRPTGQDYLWQIVLDCQRAEVTSAAFDMLIVQVRVTATPPGPRRASCPSRAWTAYTHAAPNPALPTAASPLCKITSFSRYCWCYW